MGRWNPNCVSSSMPLSYHYLFYVCMYVCMYFGMFVCLYMCDYLVLYLLEPGLLGGKAMFSIRRKQL